MMTNRSSLPLWLVPKAFQLRVGVGVGGVELDDRVLVEPEGARTQDLLAWGHSAEIVRVAPSGTGSEATRTVS